MVNDKDKPAITSWYGEEVAGSGFYAFEADGWKRLNFQICQLTQVMRQADPDFVAMLDRARVGDASCISYFNELAGQGDAPSNAVSIASSNKSAKRVNLARLGTLKGASRRFRGTVQGEFREKDMPVPELLELKVGARVMLAANNREAGYVNGSTGTVTGLRDFSTAGTEAIVVELDDGGEVAVQRFEWENLTYRVTKGRDGESRLETVKLGSFEQFPLKLAWAITYHKSQGQTLDAVSIDPTTFAPGMLYVGLSRATSAAGIWLSRKIKPEDLKTNEAVVDFYKETCGWEPPAKAQGDEKPDLARGAAVGSTGDGEGDSNRANAAPVEPTANDGETDESSANLETANKLLHCLLTNSRCSWVKTYALIDNVQRKKLYQPDYRSFSAWMKAEAEREGVEESLLWHKKSAGDFYVAWAARHPNAPSLSTCEYLPEENLNLVRKIATSKPARADEIVMRMLKEKGPSTKELRREWRETRSPRRNGSSKAQGGTQGVKASRESMTVECADAGAFDAVMDALHAAGIDIEATAAASTSTQ